MAVAAVKGKGVAVDESLAAHPTKATVAVWSPERENFQQGIGSVGGWIANVAYATVHERVIAGGAVHEEV